VLIIIGSAEVAGLLYSIVGILFVVWVLWLGWHFLKGKSPVAYTA
jgi:hypothetical protein